MATAHAHYSSIAPNFGRQSKLLVPDSTALAIPTAAVNTNIPGFFAIRLQLGAIPEECFLPLDLPEPPKQASISSLSRCHSEPTKQQK